MVCTFFGHRDTPDSAKVLIKGAIEELIEKQGVKLFYLGNNGNFDFLVQRVLEDITKHRKDVNYYIILSYPNEKALSNNQHATLFPEGLEHTPPRYAISKRNNWLIKNSSYVITYTVHKFSNCSEWIAKAQRRGLQVINIGSIIK